MIDKTKNSSLQYRQKKIFGDFADSVEMNKIFDFCEDYKAFLDKGKTERMCVSWARSFLENRGFKEYKNSRLVPGERYYLTYRNKVTVAFTAGKHGLEEGVNMLACHVDSPRLDLKPHPLYEDSDICLLKTHYYGGLKKYQWTAIPLMLTGVVIRKDGSSVDVQIGDKPDDPVFYISDILPHLGAEQMKRNLGEGIKGEELNVMAGTIPYRGGHDKSVITCEKEKSIENPVKENVLRLLNEKYDIDEEDFFTAELTLVPAFMARDTGFDRSMIAAYGHDDKVCAYTSLRALVDTPEPEKTSICVWVDKEEIGSMGLTGMQSDFLVNFLKKLADIHNISVFDIIDNSACLSADVDGAFDPTYADVFDSKNTAEVGAGIAINKYTGGGGKYDASDADAEFVGEIRKIFNEAGVIWQMSDMGKVDTGGGGTVAQFVANRGIKTLDCGVAVMSMHAPYELVSKADVYMAYRGYRAFLEASNNCSGQYELLLDDTIIKAEGVDSLLLKVCEYLAQKNVSVLGLMVENEEFADAKGYYFTVEENDNNVLIAGTGIFLRKGIGEYDAKVLIDNMKDYYGI